MRHTRDSYVRTLAARLLTIALLCVAVVATPANVDTADAQNADRPGAGQEITMARANWSSGYVQAQIMHDLLEELGYAVTSPADYEFAPTLAYVSMGQGDIDFWANSWYPGHFSWWRQPMANGQRAGDNLERVDGPLVPAGGLQGMLITKAWADEYGITTLDQINDDPALWSQLDSDGNGKGELFGCAPDWTCDDIIESQIAFAGWTNLEQVIAGYDAMFAEFMQRVLAGEPAITYVWTPTAYMAYALPGERTMWLSVNESSVLDNSNPLGVDGGASYCQRCGESIGFSDLGPDTCLQGPDGCQLGWVGAAIEITANKDWLADNPAARALFEEAAIPMIDISIAGVALSNSNGAQADVERIAAEWITDNRAMVDEWLAAARAMGPAPTVRGDANCDGVLNIVDAYAVASFVVAARDAQDDCSEVPPGSSDISFEAIYIVGEPVNILTASRVAQCVVGITNPLCPAAPEALAN